MRKYVAFLLTFFVAFCPPARVFALDASPAQSAEIIRTALVQAQIALTDDLTTAQKQLETARTAYVEHLATTVRSTSAQTDARVMTGLANAQKALTKHDAPAFAVARAQIWTAILGGSYAVVTSAVQRGDGQTAQSWLSLREFRTATRFSRPNVDATLAIERLVAKTSAPADVLVAVNADLLDTYQGRLNEVLGEIANANDKEYAMRRAEHAALAEGYFAVLSPAYIEQRGAEAEKKAQQAFAQLRIAALQNQDNTPALAPALANVQANLHNFRAAPLSNAERTRRAGQLLRYLSLVPVEYGRGVVDGHVNRTLEIQEAITFRDGAAAAFADLQNLLDARDVQRTATIEKSLATLETQLQATLAQTQIAAPAAIQAQSEQLVTDLKAIMPAEWQTTNAAGDFDVINAMLDQMETAAVAGQYDLAESARLEAYALMEVGPEARLMVFAPELKTRLEDLFWNGTGTPKGLAYLIGQHASVKDIKASRAALNTALSEAQVMLSGSSAPTAVATNAGVIVFREGLEAVLILASLLSSFKRAEEQKYRRPLWMGGLLALFATGLTWVAAHGLLMSLARYGERLEAIVSLIAIGVLLLITNWFFHKVYWTGWIANFHAQKKRLISGEAGLLLGLVMLGFTSVYREGFETVLFLQALVLEGGTGVVLTGVAIALAGVALIGVITFKLQSNLPYKKMLIYTGVMIGAVLLVMVGNTVHVLQVVGWLPIHVIDGVIVPTWVSTWFGLFATWEGIGLQIASATFVIGSYYWAEHINHRARLQGSQARKQASARPVRAH
ncbi:FTR1 family protein [soil metagenome]